MSDISVDRSSEIVGWALGFQFASDEHNRFSLDPDMLRRLRLLSGDRLSFYRGIVDCIGSIRERDCPSHKGSTIALVRLYAGPVMLWGIVDYCYRTWPHFDPANTMANLRTKNGQLDLMSLKAVRFLECFYPSDQSFTLRAHADVAKKYRGWTSREGSKQEQLRDELAVNRKLAQGLTRVGNRLAWEHMRPF